MTTGMDASFVIRIAGRRLAVCGGSELAAVRPALQGIIEAAESEPPSDSVLQIAAVPEPSSQAPWSRLATGSHRGRDGELVVIRRAPSSVEQYRPGADPPSSWQSSR
jgi:hypothetical protein